MMFRPEVPKTSRKAVLEEMGRLVIESPPVRRAGGPSRYCADPDGRDILATPEEVAAARCGDCKKLTILRARRAIDAGAKRVRLCMTVTDEPDEHVFLDIDSELEDPARDAGMPCRIIDLFIAVTIWPLSEFGDTSTSPGSGSSKETTAMFQHEAEMHAAWSQANVDAANATGGGAPAGPLVGDFTAFDLSTDLGTDSVFEHAPPAAPAPAAPMPAAPMPAPAPDHRAQGPSEFPWRHPTEALPASPAATSVSPASARTMAMPAPAASTSALPASVHAQAAPLPTPVRSPAMAALSPAALKFDANITGGARPASAQPASAQPASAQPASNLPASAHPAPAHAGPAYALPSHEAHEAPVTAPIPARADAGRGAYVPPIAGEPGPVEGVTRGGGREVWHGGTWALAERGGRQPLEGEFWTSPEGFRLVYRRGDWVRGDVVLGVTVTQIVVFSDGSFRTYYSDGSYEDGRRGEPYPPGPVVYDVATLPIGPRFSLVVVGIDAFRKDNVTGRLVRLGQYMPDHTVLVGSILYHPRVDGTLEWVGPPVIGRNPQADANLAALKAAIAEEATLVQKTANLATKAEREAARDARRRRRVEAAQTPVAVIGMPIPVMSGSEPSGLPQPVGTTPLYAVAAGRAPGISVEETTAITVEDTFERAGREGFHEGHDHKTMEALLSDEIPDFGFAHGEHGEQHAGHHRP